MHARFPFRAGRALLATLAAATLAACGGAPGAAPRGRSSAITDIGSDTIVNLALAWAEAYAKVQPAARISVTGGGSGTGINSLINGSADIANASRRMTAGEIAAAKERGISPREVVIARDAIAVIVHKSNPVSRLTIEQLAAIFSGRIDNWSEVGGEDRPIVRLSREVNSGTHVYFLEAVLRGGRKGDKTLFSADTLLLPSSEGVIAEATDNPNAIGYDGLGYVTPDVKVIAVSGDGGRTFVVPAAATVIDRTYPIARDLYMYVRADAPPQVGAYIDWILSPEAQRLVRSLGFVPIH